MKKRALLIVGLALLIAAAGVVYAHWQDTLKVNASVGTGDIDVIYQYAGTDDDGIVGNDLSGDDNNAMTQVYDAWPAFPPSASSSADPSTMWRCTGSSCAYLGGAIARYDKDVARCAVSASADSKELTATITDAYPSYHCSVFAQLSNEGTVPVKAAAFHMTTPAGGTLKYVGLEWVEATAGDTAFCNDPVNAGRCPMGIFVPMPAGWTGPQYFGMVPVITFDIANGTACGNQLDPFGSAGDNDLQAYWFHVEQSAYETATYSFSFQQDFVNWNEWKGMELVGSVIHANSCQVYINGTPMLTP